MNKLETILELYDDQTFLLADGFDDAVIGVDTKQMRLIYSVSDCIKILQTWMSEAEAIEYFYFNMYDAYVGERTPIWCEDLF